MPSQLTATSLFERMLRGIDALVHRSGRTPALAPHLETARRGEEAAFFHLRRLGYVVVARRWRSSRHPGDLDLIAREGNTVCFIEVKTRSTRDVATAESSIDEHKRRTLRRLARHYLRQVPAHAGGSPASRFDVVSIYFEKDRPAEFQLFRGAFDWS